MINLKGVTLESQKYCLRCNSFTSKGIILDIRNLNDTEYLQLQECGWRRSGEYFYHTNQNSCCQQTISKVDVQSYKQPKTIKKSLRKLTNLDIDLIKQSEFSNLLQYIDHSRPSSLRTRSAFRDFLTALSERLPCTQISPKGFKSNPPDTLNFHIQLLNQELHMDVRLDSHNCLRFRWLDDFTKLLNLRKSLFRTVLSQANYDEEAHQFFNTHYFAIKKSNYIQSFCGDQYKMVRYYIGQELVAVEFLEIRQNSLHRLALHYKTDVHQMNRIVLDSDIQLAKSMNLKYFYYTVITNNQNLIINNPITDEFVIQCGSKSIQIKNLREKYRNYMIDRLNYLSNYFTTELINGIIFTYS